MRWLAALLLGLTACTAVLGIEDVPEHECQTNIDCAGNQLNRTCSSLLRCVAEYQVLGGSPLNKRTEPTLGDNIVGGAPVGTTLGIVCQTALGDQVDGRTMRDENNQPVGPFKTWDRLDDNTYVYDGYMNTPRVIQGYSPGIKHCPGE